MNSRAQPFLDAVLIIGTPLVLALVELVHPHPHNLMHIDVQTWLAVHYAQIPLFPLAALGIATLVRDKPG